MFFKLKMNICDFLKIFKNNRATCTLMLQADCPLVGNAVSN